MQEQLILDFSNDNMRRASGLGDYTNDNKHCEVRYENNNSQIRKQDNPCQPTPPVNPINTDTGCGLIFNYLLDEQWHNIINIMRDLKPGCVNWAVRSRISDLKKKFLRYNLPYEIENRIGENGQAEYKLVKL